MTIRYLKKRDLRNKGCFFSNTFCFIDDLRVIKDHLEFDRNLTDIYLSQSQLKKEKKLTCESSLFYYN